MKYVRGVALGLPLAAAALWLVSTTTTGAPPAPEAPAAAAAPAAGASPWFDLQRQRARLDQFTAAPAVVPSRNPFRFEAPPVRPGQSAAAERVPARQPARSGDAPTPAEPVVSVRLVGVATSPSANGPSRSAILSGLGQVFIAGEGDLIAGRYRVTTVGEDAVELLDEATARVVRLALR